jgi:hypothetical protein
MENMSEYPTQSGSLTEESVKNQNNTLQNPTLMLK